MKLADVQVFPHYYENYYKSISSELTLIEFLNQRRIDVLDFYNSIPSDKWGHKYAVGKWSVKKLLRHIIDAELIFCYRALSIVRDERKPLPGWSEDEYADALNDNDLNPQKLLVSLKLQLDYTYDLFSNFSASDLKKIGNTNQSNTEVGAIGFCIVAHELHHRNVINERYLN